MLFVMKLVISVYWLVMIGNECVCVLCEVPWPYRTGLRVLIQYRKFATHLIYIILAHHFNRCRIPMEYIESDKTVM